MTAHMLPAFAAANHQRFGILRRRRQAWLAVAFLIGLGMGWHLLHDVQDRTAATVAQGVSAYCGGC